jgi:HEPN domain-containing protein
MPLRAHDWFRQAEADLRHAGHARKDSDFEWSCFAAQQAAEKAVKAVYEAHHLEGWGHTISTLLGNLPHALKVPEDLITKAKALDKHYIPTRYPNGFESGAPTDFYTADEADQATAHAKEILEFCRRHIPTPPGN